jgi:hypothetical protein
MMKNPLMHCSPQKSLHLTWLNIKPYPAKLLTREKGKSTRVRELAARIGVARGD